LSTRPTSRNGFFERSVLHGAGPPASTLLPPPSSLPPPSLLPLASLLPFSLVLFTSFLNLLLPLPPFPSFSLLPFLMTPLQVPAGERQNYQSEGEYEHKRLTEFKAELPRVCLIPANFFFLVTWVLFGVFL
jgi:hypothetical protein